MRKGEREESFREQTGRCQAADAAPASLGRSSGSRLDRRRIISPCGDVPSVLDPQEGQRPPRQLGAVSGSTFPTGTCNAIRRPGYLSTVASGQLVITLEQASSLFA